MGQSRTHFKTYLDAGQQGELFIVAVGARIVGAPTTGAGSPTSPASVLRMDPNFTPKSAPVIHQAGFG